MVMISLSDMVNLRFLCRSLWVILVGSFLIRLSMVQYISITFVASIGSGGS